MSSLATCIRKAGKALSREDADAIREIHDDYVSSGEPNAAQRAVSDYLELMATERADLVSKIEKQGGVVPATRLRYAKGNPLLDIAQAISSTALLQGKEKLNIKGKATATSLAEALVARTRKANRGRTLEAKTPRNKEIISEALALETASAMKQSDHAGNWYSDTLENAVDIAAEMHPELKTDVNARSVFLLGLAITSNGLDVATNSAAAEEVYTYFKKNGKFPAKGYGDKAQAMASGFDLANRMIDRWGLPDMVRFLNTEFTVGELNTLGFSISGETVDTTTYGSAIFGPKIGGGFYQNLTGNFAPLTMDRWWMRTWGRLTGNLLPTGEMNPVQKEKLLAAAESDTEAMEELGFTYDEVAASDKKLLQLAAAAHKRYAKSDFKDKTPLNKAGKNLDIAMNAPVIAPRNGTERAWIREVAGEALNKLKQRGMGINAASMQALLWYPEKELYLMNGVGNAKSNPTDYEQEFAKLAAEHGISESRIEAARTRDPDGRRTGYVGAAGELAVEEPTPTKLSKQERTRLLQKAATQAVRQQLPRSTRRAVPKSNERELNGAGVAHVFKPVRRVVNLYSKAGMATPDVFELNTGQDSARVFHQAISDAKAANDSGAAVHMYPVEEYENMRLFVTKDQGAGFALNGNDIVSVFKNPSAPYPNVAQSLIGLAVSEGGRRLDAFDTVLPTIYSMQGFKVVSRTPWNDAMAPEGWNKETFSEFNNGEPDVVFMVYDQNHMDAYTGQNEGVLTDYNSAVELQAEEVSALEERNKPNVMYRIEDEPDVASTVNRDPTSPLSRLHKLGATVESQADYNPGFIDRTKDAIIEFGESKGISGLLAAIPRRNLPDFIPEHLAPALKKYVRLANRMTGYRNELLTENEPLAKDWARYTRGNKRMAGKLAELMHASTLAEVDPSKPLKPLKKPQSMNAEDKKTHALRKEQHIVLQKYYNQLDAEGQRIFNAVRDSYIGQRTKIEKALEERIEASEATGKSKRAMLDLLRSKFEAGRTRGPYFPLTRYGDLWAAAKDSEGNVISYSRFENRKLQREWIKEWKAVDGVQVEKGRKMGDTEIMSRVDPGFVKRVQELVEDPAIKDEIWQHYMATLPEMSMRKRFMHRKGRMGFSADALRAYGTAMFHGAHQLSKLRYMHHMETQLRELQDQLKAVENDETLAKEFNWAAPLYNNMLKRHNAAAAPKASPWAVKLTSLGFVWYLGATAAAGVVNMTQTAIVGFPVIAANFNAVGAMKHLLKASGQYAGARGKIENSLRGNELAAFKEADRIGLFEKTQAHALAGIAETGAEALGGNMERSMEIFSFIFHKAEQFNREVTFLAAYRLAIESGATQEDAIVKAEDITWDSHFDYNNDNRPVFMQEDLWRVLTLFKQYSLNMTYRIARDFNDSIRGETKADRIKARKQFGGVMLMTGLLAGYTGLPAVLTAPITFILDSLFGDDDDEYDSEDAMRAYLAEMLGPKAAEAIMKGAVDAFTGLTLSNRVSLGELWLRDPGVNDKGDDLFMHYMMQVAGPIPATIKDTFFAGPELIAEGHTMKGIEKMLPKFVRDPMRAYRYATEGATTMNTPGDVLVAPEQFTPVDLFYQTFGFVPAKLTMQYEQNNALRTAEANIINARAKAIDRYQIAVFNNDKAGVKSAMEKIGEYNKKYPMYLISGKTLAQGSASRLNRNARSINGTTLNKHLMYLYKDLMFTPTPEKLKQPAEEEK